MRRKQLLSLFISVSVSLSLFNIYIPLTPLREVQH
jgi:hypothetical protein